MDELFELRVEGFKLKGLLRREGAVEVHLGENVYTGERVLVTLESRNVNPALPREAGLLRRLEHVRRLTRSVPADRRLH